MVQVPFTRVHCSLQWPSLDHLSNESVGSITNTAAAYRFEMCVQLIPFHPQFILTLFQSSRTKPPSASFVTRFPPMVSRIPNTLWEELVHACFDGQASVWDCYPQGIPHTPVELDEAAEVPIPHVLSVPLSGISLSRQRSKERIVLIGKLKRFTDCTPTLA